MDMQKYKYRYWMDRGPSTEINRREINKMKERQHMNGHKRMYRKTRRIYYIVGIYYIPVLSITLKNKICNLDHYYNPICPEIPALSIYL